MAKLGEYYRQSMLFKANTLEKIKSGEVKLAIRQWKRPTVKEGGTLITRVGQLSIEKIAIIHFSGLTDVLAKQAGYESLAALLKILKPNKALPIAIIHFKLIGDDPRVAMRDDQLSQEEIDEIIKILTGMDSRSKFGPWTQRALQIIHDQPAVLSTIVGEELGLERAWLKQQIRKLKGLGLTISLEVGYKLSPRGELILKSLK